MSWHITYQGHTVEVEHNSRPFAKYDLLPEAHCPKCSAPLVIYPFNTSGKVSYIPCTTCDDLLNINKIYAMGVYHTKAKGDGDLSRNILSFKLDKNYAAPLGLSLSEVIKNRYPELMTAHAMIPIPIHDEKLNIKGFNPIFMLAQQVSQKVNVKIYDCITQVKNYSQHNSNRDKRFENVQDAFKLDDRVIPWIQNEHLILIDDIMTSGATIDGCAQLLIHNGAKKVDGLVLGRTG